MSGYTIYVTEIMWWPSGEEEKKDLTVGPPTCDDKMQECAAKCKSEIPECAPTAAVAPTSGGRRKKSLKKGGRKSRKSRSYRAKSRGSKSRGKKRT